jgi:hypothetical protein
VRVAIGNVLGSSREGQECIPAVHVRDHVDLSFCCCDLLLGRELRAATEEERHCRLCVCVVQEWVFWFCGCIEDDQGGRVRMLCCCCFCDGSER